MRRWSWLAVSNWPGCFAGDLRVEGVGHEPGRYALAGSDPAMLDPLPAGAGQGSCPAGQCFLRRGVQRRTQGLTPVGEGTELTEAGDAELVDMAADGNTAAAGEFLARRLHMLTVMARRIATSTIDPDDLLAEAIANLLAKWAERKGPREHVEAYLIRSMRNRVSDELRSPRSKTVPLDADPDRFPDEQTGHHRVELHREFALVREALTKLPEDQRRVLMATVVEGRKPGDLVEEFGRPAGAIYSLSRRARIGSRRALLQVMLEENAQQECRECADQLPQAIGADLLDQIEFAGPRHIRDCAHCSMAWRRYLALVQYVGVASLLVVAIAVLSPPQPAGAVENHPDTEVKRASPGSAATTHRPRRGLRAVSRPRLGLALAATATGSVLIWAGLTSVQGFLAGRTAPRPVGSLAVSAQIADETHTTLSVAFGVDRTPWRVEELTIVIPERSRLESAPAGWACAPGAARIACTSDLESPTGGQFRFVNEGTADGQYQLVVKATSGVATITAQAEGLFPR